MRMHAHCCHWLPACMFVCSCAGAGALRPGFLACLQSLQSTAAATARHISPVPGQQPHRCRLCRLAVLVQHLLDSAAVMQLARSFTAASAGPDVAAPQPAAPSAPLPWPPHPSLQAQKATLAGAGAIRKVSYAPVGKPALQAPQPARLTPQADTAADMQDLLQHLGPAHAGLAGSLAEARQVLRSIENAQGAVPSRTKIPKPPRPAAKGPKPQHQAGKPPLAALPLDLGAASSSRPSLRASPGPLSKPSDQQADSNSQPRLDNTEPHSPPNSPAVSKRPGIGRFGPITEEPDSPPSQMEAAMQLLAMTERLQAAERAAARSASAQAETAQASKVRSGLPACTMACMSALVRALLSRDQLWCQLRHVTTAVFMLAPAALSCSLCRSYMRSLGL